VIIDKITLSASSKSCARCTVSNLYGFDVISVSSCEAVIRVGGRFDTTEDPDGLEERLEERPVDGMNLIDLFL